MKTLVLVYLAVLALKGIAMPVIQTTGTSRSIVLACTQEAHQEGRESALAEARKKAENICESEVSLVSTPLVDSECKNLYKEFEINSHALANFICGASASQDSVLKQSPVKVTCTGSCQTTGPGFSCTYEYPDGSTETIPIKTCK